MSVNDSDDPHDWIDQNDWLEHIEEKGWDADYREMVEGRIDDYFRKVLDDYEARLPFIVASQLDTLWSGLEIVSWNGFPCVAFKAGDGLIDLLAQYRSRNDSYELVVDSLVVISTVWCGVGGDEDVVKRQLRNMEWVKSNFSHLSDNVRGIIIFMSTPSEKAKSLLSANSSIEFITKIFEHSVEVAQGQYVGYMNGEISADFLYSLIGPE